MAQTQAIVSYKKDLVFHITFAILNLQIESLEGILLSNCTFKVILARISVSYLAHNLPTAFQSKASSSCNNSTSDIMDIPRQKPINPPMLDSTVMP